MGGQSDRTKAMEQMQGLAKDQFTRATALPNRFEGYTDPYNYDQQIGAVQQGVGQESNMINQQANNSIANAARGTSSRLASQGLTGGSAFNQQVAA